ncbi:hypothetical protein AB0M39_38310 [Streptomyces sp. NPDC051907]|uniref:hypothetical protein n=1 Tax=Streptomyces sp. NPDC051907 TaxID=3155284 RepID=UPI0034392237
MTDTFPEAPYDPTAQLGCALTYSAAVHWRGGSRVYIPPNLLDDRLADVQWERRLTETAPGKIVITKASMAEECCGLLGAIHPWCHELSIYRDAELVWQGPITNVTEDMSTVTIDAMDISAWLSRLVNTHLLNYKSGADPVTIARAFITANLNDSALSTPTKDWPGLLPYLTTTVAKTKVKLNRRAVWSDTVLNIVNNMAAKGFEWTTVGRRLVMRPPAGSSTRARARLTPDDLPGGIQVSRDGTDTATRVYATSQSSNENGITMSTAIKASSAVCGRIDQIVRDQPRVDVETDAEEKARKAAIAKRRDDRIKAERTDANNDLDNILEGPNTVAERKAAEARRKLRDDRIDDIRKDYEQEMEDSNDGIAAEERAEIAEVLLTEAKEAIKGRWPTPIGITVQDGAQLSTTAPLTVRELVPGERIDVATVGYCQQITQAMRLSRVSGAWTDGGEAIGISLVPLSELAEVDT